MYKRTLVASLIEEGQRLIDDLRRHRFPINEAVWLYMPESVEWRLKIVTPSVDRNGYMPAYERVQGALGRINAVDLTITDVSLVSPAGEDYVELRYELVRKSRFGVASGTIPAVVHEDAYVYSL